MSITYCIHVLVVIYVFTASGGNQVVRADGYGFDAVCRVSLRWEFKKN